MGMTAKVENYCAQHVFGTKSIAVDGSERACINCIWFERYYRENRGNMRTWVATNIGYCLLHEQRKGAMTKPCKDYETE